MSEQRQETGDMNLDNLKCAGLLALVLSCSAGVGYIRAQLHNSLAGGAHKQSTPPETSQPGTAGQLAEERR